MRASKPTDSAQPDDQSRRPDIRLRYDKLATITSLAKWTNAELARRASLDQSAVMRLTDRKIGLGRHSMAGLLVAIRQEFGYHVAWDEIFILLDSFGVEVPYVPIDRQEIAS